MHPHLSALAADEHRRDLTRATEHHRLASAARGPRRPRTFQSWKSPLHLWSRIHLRWVRFSPRPATSRDRQISPSIPTPTRSVMTVIDGDAPPLRWRC
jgi:hypothetical protein